MKINADINVDAVLNETTFGDDTNDNNGMLVGYPFMDALKTNVDDDVDLALDTQVDMCIYRINQANESLPFLEFLLYMQGNEREKKGPRLVFPHILSKHTKAGLVDQCRPALVALFEDMDAVKYVGYVHEKPQRRCTLFFNHIFNPPSGGIPFMRADNRWFWALSSEIFNERQLMQCAISDDVVTLFNRHPDVMRLTWNGRALESPSALYAGKHFNYVSYMAEFGTKKASTRAHFGPYYYFVGFVGAMRYACYSMGFEPHVLEDDGTELTVNAHGKHTRGGVVRFAVFLGRCRAFFMNGEEDRSELSMYWADQDPFVKAKLALRDINGDWTQAFNSAYVGEYELNIGGTTKNRIPNWTIKDYDNQIPLSCHEIDMTSVPNEYDPAFVKYKLI